MKKHKIKNLITLLVFFILINVSNLDIFSGNKIYYNEIYLTGLTNSIGAGNWDMLLVKYSSITKYKVDPIHIDDAATGVGAKNWTWARSQFWCTGSGTYLDPYVIENLEIDGDEGEYGIKISNSDVFFRIENCRITNTGDVIRWDACIKFVNISCGTIFENHLSNTGFGIYSIMLRESYNNSIIQNNATNNHHAGIFLWRSVNNTVSYNNASNNGQDGVYLDISSFNKVTFNNIANNSRNGIILRDNSHNNTLSWNNVSDSSNVGINIRLDTDPCSDNIISNNRIINNSAQSQDDGTNNRWDNGIIGNYWSDYGGVDADDDGIGDTPYSIGGTAGSQDNFPLWEDGDDLPPSINIISPVISEIFGILAPNFNVEINDPILDSMWYTIDGGVTNITFTTNGTIDQNNWTAHIDGLVLLAFYANDTLSHINSAQVLIYKDTSIPIINIISPTTNQLFGESSPSFNVEFYDPNLDTMWYTIDGGVTNITFTTNGTIDQNNWTMHNDGPIAITFYVNDTSGNVNFDEIIVIKDTFSPTIVINSPTVSEIFGISAPDFIVEIKDPNLDSMWYTIDGGLNNITFTTNETIDQDKWINLPDGPVNLIFYANDTSGHLSSSLIVIIKQTPILTIKIISPIIDQLFGPDAPDFIIEVTGGNANTMWYTIDNGLTNTKFTSNGTINQTLWDALPDGNVIIKFYANDTLGRIGSQEVTIVKRTSQSNPPGIPGYNILLLLGIAATIAVIIVKKKLNHLN